MLIPNFVPLKNCCITTGKAKSVHAYIFFAFCQHLQVTVSMAMVEAILLSELYAVDYTIMQS